jgi:hypothetical protein
MSIVYVDMLMFVVFFHHFFLILFLKEGFGVEEQQEKWWNCGRRGCFFFCWLYRMGFMNQPCFLFKNWHFPVDQHGKANMVKPTIKTYSRHNVGD